MQLNDFFSISVWSMAGNSNELDINFRAELMSNLIDNYKIFSVKIKSIKFFLM